MRACLSEWVSARWINLQCLRFCVSTGVWIQCWLQLCFDSEHDDGQMRTDRLFLRLRRVHTCASSSLHTNFWQYSMRRYRSFHLFIPLSFSSEFASSALVNRVILECTAFVFKSFEHVVERAGIALVSYYRRRGMQRKLHFGGNNEFWHRIFSGSQLEEIFFLHLPSSIFRVNTLEFM